MPTWAPYLTQMSEVAQEANWGDPSSALAYGFCLDPVFPREARNS